MLVMGRHNPARPAKVLGFDAPGGRAGAWAVVEMRSRLGPKLNGVGDVLFLETESELEHYRKLSASLSRAYALGAEVVVIESAFLHRIAPYVGAVKLWAAERRLPWVMLTSSAARKLVLGHGGTGKAFPRKERQAEVLRYAVGLFDARRISNQHRADAALYALAGHRYVALNRGCIEEA